MVSKTHGHETFRGQEAEHGEHDAPAEVAAFGLGDLGRG
jgi:hypothetical protein